MHQYLIYWQITFVGQVMLSYFNCLFYIVCKHMLLNVYVTVLHGD